MFIKPFRTLFSTQHSIQAKIFVSFLIVTIVSLSFVTWIWYFNSSNMIKDKAIGYAQDQIRQANQNLELLMRDFSSISTLIAIDKPNVVRVLTRDTYETQYAWFLDQKRIQNFIESLFAYKLYINGISVIGLNGNSYHAGSPFIYNDYSSQDWFEKILQARGNQVFIKHSKSPANTSLINDQNMISIARAVMLNDQPIGVVVIYIRYDIIQTVFQINSLSESTITVIDDNGNFIYNADPSITQTNIKQSKMAPIYEQLSTAARSRDKSIEADNRLIVEYRSNYTGWTTIGTYPVQTIIQDSITLRDRTVWIVVAVFLIVLLVSVSVSLQITKNLKKLRDTMRSVEEGNLMPPLSIDSRDEVGHLSVSFARMMRKINDLVEGIKMREKQKRAADLKALQSQITPHFLYNTLNTIKYLARLQHARNIEEVTVSLIELLRNSIGTKENMISIREELEYVRSYITIQNYKYAGRFTVLFQAEDDILDCKILKMVLQPVVENALIHGLEPLESHGMISIKAYRWEDIIKLEVTDNGVGMSKVQLDEIGAAGTGKDHLRFSGIGIKNVDERIKMTFGQEYGLKLTSQPGIYTTAEISIPVITDERKAHYA
jgi:two-component system sensor histidine kinase YesM